MAADVFFQKLRRGTKINGREAQRFKVGGSQRGSVVDQLISGIDYFGSDQKHQPATAEEEEKNNNNTKRKKRHRGETSEDRGSSSQEAAEGNGGGILWTSCLDRKTEHEQQEVEETSLKRLKHQHQEKVNKIRARLRINVHGCDVPDPVCTFEELLPDHRLDPRILQNLRAAGWKPTAIQSQAVPTMLHLREVLACAPTGSGKTIAFLLPLLTLLRQPSNQGLRAVVMAPTRELASQIQREVLRLADGVGFKVQTINKTNPQVVGKGDILVTTPNRLVFLLKQEPPALDLSRVQWLVVDEADRLFEAGRRGFREQLAVVFQACSGAAVRRAFFSATCSAAVEQWCRLHLDNLVTINIGQRNSAVQSVEQQLLFVGKENGKLLAIRDIISKGFLPPMLVFVQSIQRAEELFHELVYQGVTVDLIHANRTQQQRDQVVASFRSGGLWVLICTSLLARGMDFKGVNVVLNYDFPCSAIDYIHRIGRTGRAGRQGKAITFFTEDDKPLLRSIANVIRQAGCPVPDYMTGFKKIHSKARRRLETKPPSRRSIITTPPCLLKRRRRGRQKTSADEEQRGSKQRKLKSSPVPPKKKKRRKEADPEGGPKEQDD